MSDFLLHAPEGANKKPKRVGRGSSSGLGTTAGKGNKGQQSRSGSAVPYVGFEGGQMPLYRRIAHRGFSNYPFRKEYDVVNIELLEQKYSAGETVDKASLVSKGLVKSSSKLIKILGNGDLTKSLTVDVDKVSASAKAKIEKAGGSVKSAEETK
ncbi:MAG: 50S ribosomal protein L15 [Treponema sp.]|uniref:50S ribosomal protein L15 n=1 Tax=Treponema sp. TaxID=166 RepID=UPI0025F83306|nr:50S ribosomal protein L15 [Treponema sp.]MBQ9281743.1 50S ribosomal protein L15 [Treponema sp.]